MKKKVKSIVLLLVSSLLLSFVLNMGSLLISDIETSEMHCPKHMLCEPIVHVTHGWPIKLVKVYQVESWGLNDIDFVSALRNNAFWFVISVILIYLVSVILSNKKFFNKK